MAARKVAGQKVDGSVVKGVNEAKPWICFVADKGFVKRLDAVGHSLGPVVVDRSKTIRLLLETMVQAVEARGFDAVQKALKRLVTRKP